MTMIFDLKRLKEDKEIVAKYNESVGNRGKGEVHSFEELVYSVWSNVFATIGNKLSFDEEEPLQLCIKVTIEGENPTGRELCFRSSNWKEQTKE